jgi:hypothetical protein
LLDYGSEQVEELIMPLGNAFRHQSYSADPPVARYERISPGPPQSALPRQTAASDVRRAWLDRGQSVILLVHGTFAGDDGFGLVGGLERLVPEWGDRLRAYGKQFVDEYVGQAGNYVEAYQVAFQQLVDPTEQTIRVRRWCWSGENNHVGRADAALELIETIAELVDNGADHLMLWGHSHAGNVFALLTNLIAGPPDLIRQFFRIVRPPRAEAAQRTSRWQQWIRARRWIQSPAARQLAANLDIVTFGMPIRYGWETAGYRRLLHFIHHRPSPELPEYRVPFPVNWDDLVQAKHGDYVQQLGIAGTDFFPMVPSWSKWRSDYRLSQMLAANQPWFGTLDRLRAGQRVPDEGDTLLVDYAPYPDPFQRLLFGHAIYTHTAWLPFHLEQVIARFC